MFLFSLAEEVVWVDCWPRAIGVGFGDPFETTLGGGGASDLAVGGTRVDFLALWAGGLAALGVLGGAGAALELQVTGVDGLGATALAGSLVNWLILLVAKIIIVLGHSGSEEGKGGEKLKSITITFKFSFR